MLFMGAPLQVNALERGQWTHERAGDVLRGLLPLVES